MKSRYSTCLSFGISKIVAACFISMFLTYRFLNDFFYINWVAGALVIFLFIALLLVELKLEKSFLLVVFLSTFWVFWALIITSWATDISHHIKYFFVTAFYLFVSCVLSFLLLNQKYSIRRVFLWLSFSWLIVNLFLLLGFYLGLYEPAKRDFSGVFHDRNVFSITSIIVLCLYLPFCFPLAMNRSSLWAAILYLSTLLMVLISKSVTGFLGLLLVTLFFSQSFSRMARVFFSFTGFLFFLIILLTDNPISQRVDRFYLSATGQVENLNFNESAYIRRHLMTEGVNLALENPLYGVGLDNARFHVMWPNRDTGSFLHNNYLDIMTSGGFVLFFLYYMPVIYSLFFLFKSRKKIKQVCNNKMQALWYIGTSLLLLKLLYDMTWTTYFEFAMVFSVVFSVSIVFFFKRRMYLEKNPLYR